MGHSGSSVVCKARAQSMMVQLQMSTNSVTECCRNDLFMFKEHIFNSD